MQQWPNKGIEEEDCELVHTDVNNALLILQTSAVQMFYDEEKSNNVCVRPRGYTRSILVADAECKHVCLKTPRGTFNSQFTNKERVNKEMDLQ